MPTVSKKTGADVLFAPLALKLLSVAMPIGILQTYDRVVPNAVIESLTPMILGLAVVVLLDAAPRMGRGYLTAWHAARHEHALDCRAVDRMLSGDTRRFEREPPGVHLGRLFAIETLRDFHAGQATLAMVDLPCPAWWSTPTSRPAARP